ncbi:MAG: protein kinase [Chitinivibrionales bacterium]|nr:protein kinase [Chitinivibrionales bacterium]MBD3395856.1 protein kinase [Chitinivibrionales bacterium]
MLRRAGRRSSRIETYRFPEARGHPGCDQFSDRRAGLMTGPSRKNPPPVSGAPAPQEGAGRERDPFVGKTIGNCEILEKYNEGGTAYIYKAHNVRFQLDRIVKILKPSLTREEEFFSRFTQEAQLTARLDHPNILRVFDTGEVEGYFYIEMEHISGRTLRSYLQSSSRISEREILSIASQITRALDYAHNIKIEAPTKEQISGILHRDIKPENIMITPDKVVKLMDFGAAKPLNLTSDTMQGMIVGTFHYMSPEQLDGRDLDVRSDFFSLGIVLYEMFCGKKPFTAANLTSLIEKIKNAKYDRPSKLRPSISPLSEELIERLLSKSPDDRPRSAKDIHESIQICLHSYDAWGAGRKVRVPFSFKRFYPTLSLILSLLAVGVSLTALLRSPRPAGSVPAFAESSQSLLEKGREIERKGQWEEAVNIYELVPTPRDGGMANEYLEAQIRRASICFRHLNQFTKARSILEKLRMEYSDPTIDAYLGQIYFKLALYNEARDRLEVALNAKKGSIIPQTDESRREMLFYYASALDRQYTYVDGSSPTLLIDAIKAWDYYMQFSDCDNRVKDEHCAIAKKRREELDKVDAQLKKRP